MSSNTYSTTELKIEKQPTETSDSNQTTETLDKPKTPPKPKTPLFIIVIDFGGSSTKIMFVGTDGTIRFIAIEPEIVPVLKQSILDYSAGTLESEADIENSIWIEVDGQYWAVGKLAKTEFAAVVNLSESKYERALEKTLAAVWLVKEKLKIKKDKFAIALAALLPPGEYQDKEKYERYLRAALENYTTPTGNLSVSLSMFDCKPEGSGIYLLHRQMQGDALKSRVCAIVMLGYRNASILIANRGEVKTREAKTSALGFHKMIGMVQSKTAGLEEQKLIEAIVAAGDSMRIKDLTVLARSKDSKYRADEVNEIVTAVRESRPQYFQMLVNWIDSKLPSDVEEIVFCGGTADYLATDLGKHYGHLELSCHADVAIPDEIDTGGFGNRIADVLGVFLNFKSKVSLGKPKSQSKKQESTESTEESDVKKSVDGDKKAVDSLANKGDE